MEKNRISGKKLIAGAAIVCAAALCIAVVFLLIHDMREHGKAAGSTASSDAVSAEAAETSDGQDGASRIFPENLIVESVTAEKQNGGYVDADTGFIISLPEDMDADELAARLSISPEMPFKLSKTAECSYILRADSPLPKASLINISLNDENGKTEFRWAFQTVGGFKAESFFPENKSEYASISSGIEIKFSSVPDAKSAEKYFEIVPETDGEFEVHGKTLVFVPDRPLKYNSVYKINVKKGMLSAGGVALEDDLSFCFKTEKNDNHSYCYAANGISETFIKGDMPLIEIYCSDNIKNKNFSVKLYQYGTAEDGFNALKDYADSVSWEYDEYTFPTDGLDCVYESEDKLVRSPEGGSWKPDYLLLPENLEYGCYLADLTVGNFHIQRFIQISDISVYAGVLPSEAAFFINNAADGTSAAGAKITLYADGKTLSAETDESGAALAEFGSELKETGALKVEYGGAVYADVFNYHAEWEHYPQEDYYTYVYTDREAYLTTDTIRVWGLVRPRGGRNAKLPEELYLKFSYGYRDTSEQSVNNVPLNISEDGTFTAEFSIKDSKEQWASVDLMSGEDIFYCKGIQITDYVKPTYNIYAEAPFTTFMPQTNPVRVTLNAEYFDGSPAVGLDFSIGDYNIQKADPDSVRTDENGFAETSVTFEDENSWRPRFMYVSFDLNGSENEYDNHYVSAQFLGLYRDIMLESEFDGSSLTVSTSKADISKMTSLADRYDYDLMRGEPADTEVTAVLHRTWWTKVEWGSYYDFLLKRDVKKYEYEAHKEILGTYTINTKGGKGVFENLPVDDENSSYKVDLSWKDTYGQTVEDTVYLYRSYNSYNDAADYHYYTLEHEYSFKENESLDFKLKDNYNNVTEQGGRIFYALNQTDFVHVGTADGTSFSHIMTNDCVPNVYVSGAYFDGRHVFPINEDNYSYAGISFDPEERRLNIELSTDKDSYSPSENAEISMTVTDAEGKAASGAAVSVSVVDEAAFALAGQAAEPLEIIYRSVSYPVTENYYSYIQHYLSGGGGAEKGGGGDETPSIRKDFKDSAAFLTGVTDENGKARFTVKLPDNITSWRVTAQAVSSDGRGEIYAGAGKTALPSSLSFFLTPIVLPRYTEGDDICMSCKTAGAENGVDITVTVAGNDRERTITVREGQPANFGKLPKGEYTVLFAAEYDSASDAVRLPFEVTETQLETTVVKTFDLNGEGLDIDPLRWPVSLSFYDKEYLFYGEALSFLSLNSGERFDFETARNFAAMEFGYITKDEFVKRCGSVSGLARPMPYAEEDAELTALICAAAPEIVEDEAAAERFYEIIEDTDSPTEKITAAYMGLAALSEPVLPQVTELLESSSDLENADKLRLCAALALMGDYSSAAARYTELTDGKLKFRQNTVKGDMEAYIGSLDETRLSLITASILGLPEADGMARYLVREKQREISVVLELMIYLKNYSPEHEGNAVVEYSLNGKTQTVALERFGSCTLNFGEEQFKNADFRVVSGSVLCTACYEGRITEQEKASELEVKKTLTSVSGGWAPGALIKVTVTFPYVNGYGVLDDVVPSCARFAGSSENYGYVSRSGQRITGSVYKGGKIVYYIRLSTPGEYVLESAVVTDNYGRWGKSERSAVTVDDYERNV